MKLHYHKFSSLILALFILFLGVHFSCTPDTPSRTLVRKVKSILGVVSTYQYGDSRSWLQEYHDIMTEVYNMPEIHNDVERLMLNLLSSKSTNDAKLLVCKSLGTIGGDSSIPALSKLLKDPDTSHMALIALTTIPGEDVDDLLINSLDEADPDQLVGIINTLAIRRSTRAIIPISQYMENENEKIALSAIMALGTIGHAEAVPILNDVFTSEKDQRKWKTAEGLIKCLGDVTAEDQITYYNEIYQANPPLSIKYAAFKGIVQGTDKKERPVLLINTLKKSDIEFQEALIPLIRNLPADVSMGMFIESMPAFTVGIQGQLMLAIADRRDKSVRQLAILWTKSDNPEKRKIGLRCLKNVSTGSDVSLIAEIAANNQEAEKELARDCLYWMKGENVDSEIVRSLENANVLIIPELLRCIGYRKIENGNELVLNFLGSRNSLVRSEAITAIGLIGSKADLNPLLEYTSLHANKANMEPIERSITAVSMNNFSQDDAAALIETKLQPALNEIPAIIFIRALGNIGGDKAFSIIQPFVTSENHQLQFAALEVFSSWENDAPLADLEAVIHGELPAKNRNQALLGITRLVQNSDLFNQDQKSARLTRVYEFAVMEADKKILINGLSRIASMHALDFVIKQLHDPGIQEEVQDAIIRIAGNLRNSYEGEIQSRMDSLVQHTENEQFKEKINILQKSMEL